MNYHLHRNGQTVGIFSLEELRRRRETGELSGNDLVWREGMSSWQTLDSILQSGGPPPIPETARVRASSTGRHALIWSLSIVAVLFVAGMVSLWVVATVKTARRIQQVANQRSGNSSVELASKEVAVSTNTLTIADIRKRGKGFYVRQYLEGFKNQGRHDLPCDAEATQFLQVWLDSNYGGPLWTNPAAVQTLADKLALRADCEEPLILTVAAANGYEVHEKRRRLEHAVAGFEKSRHKAFPKFYATVELASHVSRQRVQQLDASALDLFKQAFSDGSFIPADEAQIADILITEWGYNFFERNCAAVVATVQDSKAYPWLALVLEGKSEVREAWAARGSGYANTVSEQGWKSFAGHLTKANTALEKAWKLHPDRALAPACMIEVAMGQSEPQEMRVWFDRALVAQIDIPLAWSSMRWGLRPRWFGSHEALLALGYRAVDTKRFDTDVPRMLFDCISDVESEQQLAPGEHIYGRVDIWPHLQQMYEGYIAEPSQDSTRNGWRSTYAAVSYLAGHYDLTRKQLEAVNWNPVRENLAAWGKDLSLMPLEVAAVTGSSADKVNRAEAASERQDFANAIKIFTEVSDSSDADERTREFSRSRLVALKEEQVLSKGEWIDLLPTGDKDPNWAIMGDKIRRLPDGALEVESGANGHGFYSRTVVGPEFEVTGEFEVVRTSNSDFQAGLIIGVPDSTKSRWYAFRMKKNATEGQVVSFSYGWGSQQVAKRVSLNPDHNSFQFRLQNGKADAWLNGTQVLRQAAPSKNLRLYKDCMVGLGAFSDANETVIRYRNVKLRRLVPGR
jgi:hypothetical protein